MSALDDLLDRFEREYDLRTFRGKLLKNARAELAALRAAAIRARGEKGTK